LIRERIVHDLPEAEKPCSGCGKDLRLFDEEISERYEYIPASIKVIEDVRRKYACSTAQKTLAVPQRSHSLSRLAWRPGAAGEAGRTSACSVTGFSSTQTTGCWGSYGFSYASSTSSMLVM
jgi:hypothetical protein